jgi:predicted GNAT family acetyltransferase
MLEEYQSLELSDNKEDHRFELVIDGETAFIEYLETPGPIALEHTEVPNTLGGKGVAAALVEKTFLYLEGQGRKIVPHCPYIQAFLKRHPEWDRIVEKG